MATKKNPPPSDHGLDRARIQDVAREAGCSIMSVSRAMRGVDGVSPDTRERILAIARRMGYAPNRMAGSLAAAASNLVAISVPTLFDAVFAEIINGMHPALRHAGFETMIETSDYDEAREAAWIERMIAWAPAAMIVCGTDHTSEARQRLAGSKIPTLEIWDVSPHPIDLNVGIDHYAAGLAMGEHLVGLGYRRPAYIGITAGRDPRAEKRAKGLADAFSTAGLKLHADIRVQARPSFEAGRDGAIEALALPRRPDVLYFLNDHLAFGGLMACEAAGLATPDDIGIAGFNGLNINDVLPLRLTTSVTPRNDMGEQGARLLIAAIRGVRTERGIEMPVILSPGETTIAR